MNQNDYQKLAEILYLFNKQIIKVDECDEYKKCYMDMALTIAHHVLMPNIDQLDKNMTHIVKELNKCIKVYPTVSLENICSKSPQV